IKDHPTMRDLRFSHVREPILPGTPELVQFLSQAQTIRLRNHPGTRRRSAKAKSKTRHFFLSLRINRIDGGQKGDEQTHNTQSKDSFNDIEYGLGYPFRCEKPLGCDGCPT